MTTIRTIKRLTGSKRRYWDKDDRDQHWRQVGLGTNAAGVELRDLQRAVSHLGHGAVGLVRAELASRAARAFRRPPELTPDEWAALLAAAEGEAYPMHAIREAQTHLADGGRALVRALAAVCYRKHNYDPLPIAGQTDSAIMAVAQVVALATGAALAV